MALKIKTREEAIAVLRDMVKRKREMEAKAQIDFAKATAPWRENVPRHILFPISGGGSPLSSKIIFL